MGKVLVFDLMYKDEICTHVKADFGTKEVEDVQYSQVPHRTVFGKMPRTIDNLLWFLETRCVPRNRADLKEILEYNGIKEYDPLTIVRKTHGTAFHDDMWIQFEGENFKYEEVKNPTRP